MDQLPFLLRTSSIGPLPGELVLMMIMALVISSCGFFRVVYFVSVGYAFSISGMSLFCLLRFHSTLDVLTVLYAGFLFLYGIRLGTYLAVRESRSAYRRELEDSNSRSEGVTGLKKMAIWLGVSFLYAVMFGPALYSFDVRRAQGTQSTSVLAIVGLAVMCLGLLLEAAADWQKAAFKKKHPDTFCNIGLYRFSRCPNYLGEIVFWIGNFTAGIVVFSSWLHWITSAFGFVCIVLIMLGSTKRLEANQKERYGSKPEFKEYAKSTPVLFPFVPIYSLKNLKVFLE